MRINELRQLNSFGNNNVQSSANLCLANKDNGLFSCNKIIVRNTLNDNCISNCTLERTPNKDVFEKAALADNKGKNFLDKLVVKNTLNKNVSFGGPFPQFIIEQDDASLVNDMKSCSFNGGLNGEQSANVLKKIYNYFRNSLSV
ncbi:hypothetical protein IJG72_06185 [bacterium]|nr:hypothetical protein [bacterium]